jgi:hypothetical protein
LINSRPVTGAIDFFPEPELACKGSGTIRLDPRFAEALPKLRKAWNKPLTPNSVCRTPAHNKKVGGHPNSLHLTENPKWPTFGTMACDIRWRDWSLEDQQAFAELALSQGWRVGLHNGFCHLDRLLDIAPESVKVFLYGTYTGPLYPRLKK